MNKHLGLIAPFALLLGLSFGACTVDLEDVTDQVSNGQDSQYAYPDSCSVKGTKDLCQDCCETQGYSIGWMVSNTCGCQNERTDETTCAGAAQTGSSCRQCCQSAGGGRYSWLGSPIDSCLCRYPTAEPNVENE